jgi:hypothetical protein
MYEIRIGVTLLPVDIWWLLSLLPCRILNQDLELEGIPLIAVPEGLQPGHEIAVLRIYPSLEVGLPDGQMLFTNSELENSPR